MGIHCTKQIGMENEITPQKRCEIRERGMEGPCDNSTEICSIAHVEPCGARVNRNHFSHRDPASELEVEFANSGLPLARLNWY